MEKASIYLRGQVWYWNDPLYGSKEENKNSGVLKLDPSLRFSRYVIILQNTDDINRSLLVIPISSSSFSPYDVSIKLPSCPTGTAAYARTVSMFPAHVQCLETYKCTLSEQTMKRIESMIAKLILPNSLPAAKPELIQTELNIDEKEKPVLTKTKSKVIWNELNIRRFMTIYQKDGIEGVCKEFGLGKATVSVYYYKFKRKVDKKIKATM